MHLFCTWLLLSLPRTFVRVPQMNTAPSLSRLPQSCHWWHSLETTSQKALCNMLRSLDCILKPTVNNFWFVSEGVTWADLHFGKYLSGCSVITNWKTLRMEAGKYMGTWDMHSDGQLIKGDREAGSRVSQYVQRQVITSHHNPLWSIFSFIS